MASKAREEGAPGLLHAKEVRLNDVNGIDNLRRKAEYYDQLAKISTLVMEPIEQGLGPNYHRMTRGKVMEYMEHLRLHPSTIRGAGGIKSPEEIQPGVVLKKRVARKPKRCSACHCPIMPGESYWDRKVSWQRYSQPLCDRCKEALGPTIKVDKSPEEILEQLRKTWPITIGDAGLQGLPATLAIRAESKKPPQSPPTLLGTKVLIDRFLEAKKNRLRPDSITTYVAVLRPFAQLHTELPLEPEPIDKYLGKFSNETTTARDKFNVLRAFYNWLEKRGKIPVNPIKMVDRPAGQADEIVPLNAEQNKVLHSFPKTDREQAYVGLMLDQAFRLSETIRLNVGDIHGDRILVHGKERREWFPLLDEVRGWLLKLANGRAPGEPLFAGRQGRLSDSQVQLDIKRLLEHAGINGVRQSPHTLRHTFSTLAYLAGCDWDAVELLLRQKEKKRGVTNRYIHLSPEQRLELMREKLERYSPLRLLAKTELGIKPDYTQCQPDVEVMLPAKEPDTNAE